MILNVRMIMHLNDKLNIDIKFHSQSSLRYITSDKGNCHDF